MDFSTTKSVRLLDFRSFSDNGTATQPIFGEIAADATKRQNFANNVVHFLQQYGTFLILLICGNKLNSRKQEWTGLTSIGIAIDGRLSKRPADSLLGSILVLQTEAAKLKILQTTCCCSKLCVRHLTPVETISAFLLQHRRHIGIYVGSICQT